jgi:hypothetical protein
MYFRLAVVIQLSLAKYLVVHQRYLIIVDYLLLPLFAGYTVC